MVYGHWKTRNMNLKQRLNCGTGGLEKLEEVLRVCRAHQRRANMHTVFTRCTNISIADR